MNTPCKGNYSIYVQHVYPNVGFMGTWPSWLLSTNTVGGGHCSLSAFGATNIYLNFVMMILLLLCIIIILSLSLALTTNSNTCNGIMDTHCGDQNCVATRRLSGTSSFYGKLDFLLTAVDKKPLPIEYLISAEAFHWEGNFFVTQNGPSHWLVLLVQTLNLWKTLVQLTPNEELYNSQVNSPWPSPVLPSVSLPRNCSWPSLKWAWAMSWVNPSQNDE